MPIGRLLEHADPIIFCNFWNSTPYQQIGNTSIPQEVLPNLIIRSAAHGQNMG